MRETVFFRLPEHPDAEVLCRFTSEAAVASSPRRIPYAQLGELTAGRRVIVFVPSADIRLTRVAVPVRQPAKALQAAPFLLEDQFAEEVDQLHFALGIRRADGSFPVAAVSRARFEGWLAQLAAVGVEPHALVPETLALPWTAGSWTALADDAQLIVRTDDCAGLTASPEELELLLKLAIGEGPAPRLRILVPQASPNDFSGLQVPVELAPGYSDPLDVLVRHYAPEAINLLQGPYARSTSWQQYIDPWRRVMWLAAAVFIVGVAVNGAQALRLNKSSAQQEAANEQRFTTIFPTERPTSYLSSQLEGLMRRSQSGDTGVMFVLQRLASALNETPGLTLRAFQYHDHALFADMTGKDVEALEKLRAWFTANPGVKFEVQSADAGSEGVQIRIKLSAS